MSERTSLIANALTRSGALKFGSFNLKSGVSSPYYIDLSWLLASPEDFESIVDVVTEEIKSILLSGRIDKLASMELKGALLLPSIANKLKMPSVIVRKETKTYGLIGRIAGGEVKRGDHVIFFDDVVSSGGSKLEGIRPIEEAGGIVETVLVVVDREHGGRETLEKQGYQVKALTTISDLVDSLHALRALSRGQAKKILEYLKKYD
jgi:orotate phosphoribosyltransferase